MASMSLSTKRKLRLGGSSLTRKGFGLDMLLSSFLHPHSLLHDVWYVTIKGIDSISQEEFQILYFFKWASVNPKPFVECSS